MPAFAVCGSGRQGYWTSSGLAEGAYRLEVRGQDALTGTGATQGGAIVSTEFAIDGQLPTTWISRPTGTYDVAVRDRDVHRRGRDAVPVSGVPDRSGAGDVAGLRDLCGSGRQGYWTSARLADGAYRLEVRGQDALTGTGPTQGGAIASTDFGVDVPLEVEWIARPQGTIEGRGVTATFSADGATALPVPARRGVVVDLWQRAPGDLDRLSDAGIRTRSRSGRWTG